MSKFKAPAIKLLWNAFLFGLGYVNRIGSSASDCFEQLLSLRFILLPGKRGERGIHVRWFQVIVGHRVPGLYNLAG